MISVRSSSNTLISTPQKINVTPFTAQVTVNFKQFFFFFVLHLSHARFFKLEHAPNPPPPKFFENYLIYPIKINI